MQPQEATAQAMGTDGRPAAPMQTESFRKSRPEIVGPNDPEAPFPIFISGAVQHGFGRGSKELGCPTANLPDESLPSITSVTKTGVYFGYAQVVVSKDKPLSEEDQQIYPMVMSLGWNPFYKSERMSAEIHIMHGYASDFYDYEMRAVVLGYIRPELDYTSRDALIEDIEMDKRVALKSLARPAYQEYAVGEWERFKKDS